MYSEKERGEYASCRSPSKHGPYLSKRSSNKSSPRNSANSPRRSARPITDVIPCLSVASPRMRPGYRNASTQYSPMAEATQNVLQAKAFEVGKQRQETGDKIQLFTTKSPSNHSPAALIAVQSPETKRRQPKEATELNPSTAAANQSRESINTNLSQTVPKVLPARYEHCNVEDIVILIADMLSELIKTNDNIPLKDVELTRFHSIAPPGISVLDYLQRLAKHATLSPPLLLSMVYYIDRLCDLYPEFSVNSLTVHRFLIAAATVSAKGLSDSFWNNSTYARVGGIKLAELRLLELDLLRRLDWRIVPKPEVLVDYYRGLVARAKNYVFESDFHNFASTSRERNDSTFENKRFNVYDVTGVKWDQGMEDVTDSSRSKKARNTS